MDIIVLIVIVIFGVSSILMALSNWVIFFRGYILRKHTQSWNPLLAGLLGAIAIFLIPIKEVSSWWWLPFFLDWGSIPGIGHAVFWHIKIKNKPKN